MKIKKNTNRIEIFTDCKNWSKHAKIKKMIRLAVRTCLDMNNIVNHEVCLLLSNDAKILELSKKYLNKDSTTNVLSFPSKNNPIGNLGDIIISYEECSKEAKLNKLTLDDHVCHLSIHGLLHLLGYDHIKFTDFLIMKGLEIQTLRRLNIANPYEDDFVES